MNQVLALIESRKQGLENSHFCKWLSGSKSGSEDPFSFTPSMLFWVLGFKDILSYLRVKDPKSVIEHQINTHCDEDLSHWTWYLKDLETLGFTFESWGNSVTDVFKKIWGDECEPTRRMVYQTISYIDKAQSPLIRLIIIEVLEAAFGAFIKHMNVPTKRSNMYGQLDYFGKTHVEKEESHSLGSWTGDNKSDIPTLSHRLDEATRAEAFKIILDLFDQFESLFNCWYQNRNTFSRNTPAAVVVSNLALQESSLEEAL